MPFFGLSIGRAVMTAVCLFLGFTIKVTIVYVAL